jgi:hypothetical protein
MDQAAQAPSRERRAGRTHPHRLRLRLHRPPVARHHLDSLNKTNITRICSEKIFTRASKRPELVKTVIFAPGLRTSRVRITLVVHEHKRLGRGIDLTTLAGELKASDVGLDQRRKEGPAPVASDHHEDAVRARRTAGCSHGYLSPRGATLRQGTELGFRGQVNYLPSMPLSGERTNQPDVHWLPTPSIVNCFRLFRFLSDPRHELADESIRVEFKIAAESTSRLAQDRDSRESTRLTGGPARPRRDRASVEC